MKKVNRKASQRYIETPGGSLFERNVFEIKEDSYLRIEKGKMHELDIYSNELTRTFRNYKIDKLEEITKIFDIETDDKTEEFLGRPKSGWIVYSGWMNNSNEPITFFRTSWMVPKPPSTDNSQLIYLFNGIQNRSSTKIIQPVLQWGISNAGGDSSWFVTNWYIDKEARKAYYKTAVPVRTGEVIEGIIKVLNISRNGFDYLSCFRDIPECDLRVERVEELSWAVQTLECRRLTSFSDYPDEIRTDMADIEIHVGGRQANINWTAHNDITDCGQKCVILRDGSPRGLVRLFYKKPPNA